MKWNGKAHFDESESALITMKITEAVFLEVFEKFKNTVYAVVFNYVRNGDDAADLEQEAFLKLLCCETEFESEDHIKAWLIRVAINLCKNHLRDHSYRSELPLSEEMAVTEEEMQGDLLRYVLALPEKYRVPLHLFYYEDYSVKQIAEVTGMPEATVKIRLKRGREKLGKSLRKEDWF